MKKTHIFVIIMASCVLLAATVNAAPGIRLFASLYVLSAALCFGIWVLCFKRDVIRNGMFVSFYASYGTAVVLLFAPLMAGLFMTICRTPIYDGKPIPLTPNFFLAVSCIFVIHLAVCSGFLSKKRQQYVDSKKTSG